MDQTVQAIVAATVSFFVVILIFSIINLLCNFTQKRRRRCLPTTHSTTQTRSIPTTTSSSNLSYFDASLKRISMPELLQSTRNFHPELIIGDGSFGLVYKAQLSSGLTVAVKKLDSDAFHGFREFRAEMETLGKIHHPNIVKILGFYASGSDRVLIYEFIEKGSLDQWLHDTSPPQPNLSLSWNTRVNIIKGVARALHYMHNLDIPIIHRDIKASNVLLDANFEAHLADFGLARRIEGSQSHVSTQVAGTMGYMPPEYFHGSTMATMMGDVYSFGILMLEIVTARRPNLPFIGEEGKEIRLIDWLRKMVGEKRELELVDGGVERDGLKEEDVVEFFRIALVCTNEISKFRPGIKRVLEFLNEILT